MYGFFINFYSLIKNSIDWDVQLLIGHLNSSSNSIIETDRPYGFCVSGHCVFRFCFFVFIGGEEITPPALINIEEVGNTYDGGAFCIMQSKQDFANGSTTVAYLLKVPSSVLA